MGPFQVHLQTSIEFLARSFHLLYCDFLIEENPQFADFHISMDMSTGFRRWYRPRVFFRIDNEIPFAPLPSVEALAMLEWCLNWCIETRAHQYLIFHAAIVEKYGSALVLPGKPGSGKSTLTAGLVYRGWRLLSDELTLIDPATGTAIPIARPIGLKNQSIEVIRKFAPEVVIGPPAFDKVKGTIAHVRPPAESVQRAGESALPKWVVFPKYEAGSPSVLKQYLKPNALLRLADSAFNYTQHGLQGFETLCSLIERCGCYEFTYGRLEEAIDIVDSLVCEPLAARV